MNASRKDIGEVMEEYARLHNFPLDVTETITHTEFVKGLQDKTVGFAIKGGEPIRLASRTGRLLFTVCFLFYLLAPVLVIPVWAYHERNWWLLLGIIVACLIAPQLAQRKGNLVGVSLFLAGLVFLFATGLHSYPTFLSLCALWSYFFFQLEAVIKLAIVLFCFTV